MTRIDVALFNYQDVLAALMPCLTAVDREGQAACLAVARCRVAFVTSRPIILGFFTSRDWQSWDVPDRPVPPERMPALVDDDPLFDDDHEVRPTTVVNQWLRELPTSGCPAPRSRAVYARAVRDWAVFGRTRLGVSGIDALVTAEKLLLPWKDATTV